MIIVEIHNSSNRKLDFPMPVVNQEYLRVNIYSKIQMSAKHNGIMTVVLGVHIRQKN